MMRSQALAKPIAPPETPDRRLWRAQRQWMEQHADKRFTPEGSRRDRLGRLEAMVEAAVQPGIVGVLGNHDTAALVPVFEEAGVTCLINEGKRVTRSGATLAITGLDDVHRFYSDAALASLDALRPRADELGIALVHSPELAPEA